MNRTICTLTLLLLVALTFAAWRVTPGRVVADEPEPATNKADEKDADVTAMFAGYNSEKYNRPPTEFRKGHVTPRELPADSIHVSETGFTISLPSGAPVPTPTIYKDKLYVSGGFHSKEFYCFDAETGKLVWGIDLDDDGPTSAVVSDGVVVFNTESCTVFAVDAETGEQLWSWFLGDPLMSTPTIARGKVFTSYPIGGGGYGGGAYGGNYGNANQAPAQNELQQQQVEEPPTKEEKEKPKGKTNPPVSHVFVSLDLKTGKILWQSWIDADVMSAPVAVGDEVYATSFAGTVFRFKQDSGKLISARKEGATSAPVVSGDDVYFTRRADGDSKKAHEGIARNSRATGKAIFLANRKPAPYLDATVQARSGYAEKGAQLDAGNGFAGGAPAASNAEAAQMNIGQGNVSTCQAFQGSRILNGGEWNFNCLGNEVLCTNAATGKKRWSFKLKGDLEKVGGALAAPPASAGGRLFICTLAGDVLCVDPEKGKIEKRYKTGAALRGQPAIHNGRIYVGTEDGKVICVNTGNKKFSGWLTWGGNAAHTGIAN